MPAPLFGLVDPLQLFFALVIGHMVADYPLQTEFLAIGKNHRLPLDQIPGGLSGTRGVWIHCLTAHALIHGGTVWIITGSVILALCEVVLHWVIDFMKSAGWTNLHVDQLLHLVCKGAYVWVIHTGLLVTGS